MDPAAVTALSALAATTITVLQPYWPVFATKAVETLGEDVPETVGKVWTAIAARFAKKPEAQKALKESLADPQDADLQTVVKVELKKLLTEDRGFAAALKQLVDVAETSYRAKIQNSTSSVIVQGTGNTVTLAPTPDVKKK